jgi:hypothetical protein
VIVLESREERERSLLRWLQISVEELVRFIVVRRRDRVALRRVTIMIRIRDIEMRYYLFRSW